MTRVAHLVALQTEKGRCRGWENILKKTLKKAKKGVDKGLGGW